MMVVVAQGQRGTQAILLDQFGVLHDGQNPYPGAIEAVTALADSGRSVLIISNSSRRMHPHNSQSFDSTVIEPCWGVCGIKVVDFFCVFIHIAMSRGSVSWQLDEQCWLENVSSACSNEAPAFLQAPMVPLGSLRSWAFPRQPFLGPSPVERCAIRHCKTGQMTSSRRWAGAVCISPGAREAPSAWATLMCRQDLSEAWHAFACSVAPSIPSASACTCRWCSLLR